MSDHPAKDTRVSAADPWSALAALVDACEGEVEEVFRGEIQHAMNAARSTLGYRVDAAIALGKLTETASEPLEQAEVGDLISITLPAKTWRTIIGISGASIPHISYGADIGRAFKALAGENPERYRTAVGIESDRMWFVNKIMQGLDIEVPEHVVARTVSLLFDEFPDLAG